MRLLNLYPKKGFFLPGERIELQAEIISEGAETGLLRLTIFHLASQVEALAFPVRASGGRQRVAVAWEAPPSAVRGYGVEAELLDAAHSQVGQLATAFDVLPSWTASPRYGFLTDFTPQRQDVEESIERLARFHLNGLQMYDWQFRHDRLLPPEERYVDPLGRPLSLDTVRRFIEAARQRGMATLAYLAIYAASFPFWRSHPDWALYDAEGHPIPFGDDFLGLMDPSPGGPWAEHLLAECGRALGALAFDGLHIDQYGQPREGYNAAGEPVDLPGAFAAFIRSAKERWPRRAVLFNAVENWPASLNAAPQDFHYIELWLTAHSYRELREVVRQARAQSGGKPVVVALYLPPERPANIRLANAILSVMGSSRIELGENGRLLTDPYFPKHQPIPAELASVLRRQYDFCVRYGELIGPSARLVDMEVSAPESVWWAARQAPGWLALGLVNMKGLEEARWDEAHPPPSPLRDLPIRLRCPERVQRVYWASPDRQQIGLERLDSEWSGGEVRVQLPSLDYWSMLALELAEEG